MKREINANSCWGLSAKTGHSKVGIGVLKYICRLVIVILLEALGNSLFSTVFGACVIPLAICYKCFAVRPWWSACFKTSQVVSTWLVVQLSPADITGMWVPNCSRCVHYTHFGIMLCPWKWAIPCFNKMEFTLNIFDVIIITVASKNKFFFKYFKSIK